jgi:hypothetical protein
MTTFGLTAAARKSVQLKREKHRQTKVAEIFRIGPSSLRLGAFAGDIPVFGPAATLGKNIYHRDVEFAEKLFMTIIAIELLFISPPRLRRRGR